MRLLLCSFVVVTALLPGCRLFSQGIACDPADAATCPEGTTCSADGVCVAGDDPPPPGDVPPVCGDGVKNGDEACDFNGDATCNGDCTVGACGDGKVGANEECDDDNDADGDGCEACVVVAGSGVPVCGDGVKNGDEDCDFADDGDACNTDCTDGVCGDGKVDGDEECDDENANTDDGCAGCQLRVNAVEFCGDGVVNGTEQCEPSLTPDACNSDCTNGSCGDGKVDGDEECDDENADATDGCAGCLLVASSEIPPVCGDGVENGTEECDFAATPDVCNGDCTDGVCGDGKIDGDEECDDENGDDGDGCEDCLLVGDVPSPAVCGDGTVNGSEACDFAANANLCNFDCTVGVCGDGKVDGDEECDAVDGSCVACRLVVPAFCGNGQSDGGEACDPGVASPACNRDCTLAACGDNKVSANEECDDGNDDGDDGCAADCTALDPAPFCGDGDNSGEACDASDAGETQPCNADCTVSTCGDGKTGPGEECDAGGATLLRGLNGTGNDSTFETGTDTTLPSQNWTALSGSPRVADGLGGNGVLINGAAVGLANYGVQYNTGITLRPSSLYALHIDMGFVAGGFTGTSARFKTQLGVLNGNTFTPLIGKSGSVLNTGNFATGNGNRGVASGSVDLTLFTGDVVSVGTLAVRWEQTANPGPNDFFGIDNVKLTQASAFCRPSGAPRGCEVPRCGDGVKDLAEACDGGLLCTATCAIPVTDCRADGTNCFPVTPPALDAGNVANNRGPFKIELADMNNDGNLDIVGASNFEAGIITALGNGNGTFAPAVTSAPGGVNSFLMTVVDVDADGIKDVVLYGDNQFSVFYGLGDGALIAGTPLSPVGDDPRDIFAADLDGDGVKDDVGFVSRNFSGLHSLRPKAGNRPQPPLEFAANSQNNVVTPSGAVCCSVSGTAGDFDNDGDVDVVLTNDGFTGAAPFLGDGQLAFLRKTGANFVDGVIASARQGRAMGGSANADIDGDGNLDVISSAVGVSAVVFFGDGTGNFPTSLTLPLISNGGTKDVEIVDFNGDGRGDVVTVNEGGFLQFHANQGGRVFAAPFSRATAGADKMAVGDVDGDDFADVVVSVFANSTFITVLSH